MQPGLYPQNRSGGTDQKERHDRKGINHMIWIRQEWNGKDDHKEDPHPYIDHIEDPIRAPIDLVWDLIHQVSATQYACAGIRKAHC